MSLRVYKNIDIFLLFWMVLFFISEFLLNLIFEDQTPVWKIVTVSLFSAAVFIFPILKDSKDFSLDHVRKKQKRSIVLYLKTDQSEINKMLVNLLEANRFKIISNDSDRIKCKTKWNLNSLEKPIY